MRNHDNFQENHLPQSTMREKMRWGMLPRGAALINKVLLDKEET